MIAVVWKSSILLISDSCLRHSACCCCRHLSPITRTMHDARQAERGIVLFQPINKNKHQSLLSKIPNTDRQARTFTGRRTNTHTSFNGWYDDVSCHRPFIVCFRGLLRWPLLCELWDRRSYELRVTLLPSKNELPSPLIYLALSINLVARVS